MTMTVLKISFWSLYFQQWFQFLEIRLIWFKKVSTVKKLPISDSKRFLKSIFDLKWSCKILLKQTVQFEILTQLTCLIFSLKIREMLWKHKKYRKTKLSRILGRVKTKNLFPQTVWKFPLWALHFQRWLQFLEKTLIRSKKS